MDIIPPRNSGARPVPTPPPRPPAPNPPPAEPRSPGEKSPLHSVLSTIALFATAFSIAFLLNTFVIQSYQVDGQSMETTLQNNDRLIVNKIPRTLSRITGRQYVPRRGDIIIFNQAGLPGFVGEKQLIKRVVGLPGERVVVGGGKITVFNAKSPKGFNPDLTGLYQLKSDKTIGNVDVQLRGDQLFVSGDNRNNSEDSRYFGPINTNQVVAKMVLRILPFNKAQRF